MLQSLFCFTISRAIYFVRRRVRIAICRFANFGFAFVTGSGTLLWRSRRKYELLAWDTVIPLENWTVTAQWLWNSQNTATSRFSGFPIRFDANSGRLNAKTTRSDVPNVRIYNAVKGYHC